MQPTTLSSWWWYLLWCGVGETQVWYMVWITFEIVSPHLGLQLERRWCNWWYARILLTDPFVLLFVAEVYDGMIKEIQAVQRMIHFSIGWYIQTVDGGGHFLYSIYVIYQKQYIRYMYMLQLWVCFSNSNQREQTIHYNASYRYHSFWNGACREWMLLYCIYKWLSLGTIYKSFSLWFWKSRR